MEKPVESTAVSVTAGAGLRMSPMSAPRSTPFVPLVEPYWTSPPTKKMSRATSNHGRCMNLDMSLNGRMPHSCNCMMKLTAKEAMAIITSKPVHHVIKTSLTPTSLSSSAVRNNCPPFVAYSRKQDLPEAGLEPARTITALRILSPLRLPFHHSGTSKSRPVARGSP